MKIESNKNWTTCLRLNTGDGSPRVFLLNSHFLGSVPKATLTLNNRLFIYIYFSLDYFKLRVNDYEAYGFNSSSNGKHIKTNKREKDRRDKRFTL